MTINYFTYKKSKYKDIRNNILVYTGTKAKRAGEAKKRLSSLASGLGSPNSRRDIQSAPCSLYRFSKKGSAYTYICSVTIYILRQKHTLA